MRFSCLHPDASRTEIEDELSRLRTRQLLTVIPSIALEIGEDIDALIGMWASKTMEAAP